jgi:hypothetical protein
MEMLCSSRQRFGNLSQEGGVVVKGAIVFDYTRPHAGREKLALEAFSDALTFFGKLAADDKVDEPLIFMGASGRGMMIVPGEIEILFDILYDEDFLKLVFRSGLAVPDLKYELMSFGERVQHQMDLWAEVTKELEFI